MKKRIFTSLILPVLLMPFLLACGTIGYGDICNYIKDYGKFNAQSGIFSISYSDDTDSGFGAWYDINSNETIFGVYISAEYDEWLMVSAPEIRERYKIEYVLSDSGETVVEADGVVIAESLEVTDLIVKIGSSANAERINLLIRSLLFGVDKYIFGNSGIKMSNLGFKY